MTLAAKLSKPLIISCAITGAITTRKDHPRVPYTPAEIVDSALNAINGGASVVHIHVREQDGTPSNRSELYTEVFAAIRKESDALICATTGSGAGRFSGYERMTALHLGPDLASLDAGSMNFGDRVFENSPDFLRSLAREISSRNILAEVEVFDVGMIYNALRLGEERLLPGAGGKWWFQFCLGVRGGAAFDARVLLMMRDLLPENSEWSVLGIGRAQLPAALVALVEGGHIRTGMEDNVYYRKGQLADSNAQLVTRIVDLARQIDRPVATPADARRLLGLEGVKPKSDNKRAVSPELN